MGRYPWTELLFFEVLHILVFYPTHHHFYRLAVLAATIYITAKIYATPEITDPLTTTYFVGCRLAFHFIFVAYVLGSEGPFPDHWRRVRDGVHSDNRPSNFPVTKKLWWMLDLTYSVRMVGWVQEPRNCLPLPPPPSRRKFLWKTFRNFIFNAIILDLITLPPRYPALNSGPENTLGEVPFLRRLPYVLVFGFRLRHAVIDYVQRIAALVCVGLGHADPTLWPDMMGRWSDAYTVRKFWGRSWHQQMRPMFNGLGRLVANKFLKFPRGTNRSSYTQLYLAFFLSAVIHVSGDFMAKRGMVYCSLKFFLLQAVAITFEDFIIYVAKRLLLQAGITIKPGVADDSWVGTVLRIIGYCWVALWFCFSLPLWQDGNSSLQYADVDEGYIVRFISNGWKYRA